MRVFLYNLILAFSLCTAAQAQLKISQYPQATNVVSLDDFLINKYSGGIYVTKRVAAGNILSYIQANYTAGGFSTLNVTNQAAAGSLSTPTANIGNLTVTNNGVFTLVSSLSNRVGSVNVTNALTAGSISTPTANVGTLIVTNGANLGSISTPTASIGGATVTNTLTAGTINVTTLNASNLNVVATNVIATTNGQFINLSATNATIQKLWAKFGLGTMITNIETARWEIPHDTNVLANSTLDITQACPGAKIGDSVIVNPETAFSGIVYSGFVPSAGNVTLRFANVKTNSVNISSLGGNSLVIRATLIQFDDPAFGGGGGAGE